MPRSPNKATRPPKAQDKTILVVDDEPNVRIYLQSILVDAGFNVITAGDGEQALAMIKQKKPDFISLDLIMPRKSGHKLLFELKRSPELSRIPVLIVTAHARDEMGQKDLEDILQNRVLSGPRVYLEKPVKPHTYVQSIQRALGLQETPMEVNDKAALESELQEYMREATPEALQEALRALKKAGQE